MQRNQGLSLIELLVVMGIIAAVTSVAIGMIRRGDSTTLAEAGARVIRADLRLARSTARRVGLGSVVRISGAERTVEIWPAQLGGSWHFEDMAGSRGTVIELGGTLVEGGYLSRCLECTGASATVLGDYPFYDAPNGLRMTIAVNPQGGSGGVLASRPGVFKLSVTDEGALLGQVVLAPKGERLTLETRDGVVAPGVWSVVSLSYDRTVFQVSVADVVYAEKAARATLSTASQGPLIVGGGGYVGRLDEARLMVMPSGEVSDLPGRVDVATENDIVVHFDAKGRLHRTHHKKGISILLSADEDTDSQASIVVEMSGLIR